MKTTKQEALKIYEIVTYINPYEVCDLDKDEIIDSFMEIDFEENLKELQRYICESYDSIQDLLNDTKCMKLYLNLKEKQERK